MMVDKSESGRGSTASTTGTPGDSNEIPVINVEAALARMGQDRSLLEDVAQFFLEDAPELVAQIRRGVEAGDAAGVAHSAHSLKGLSSNFDAVAVHVLAAEIEQHGRANRIDGAASLVDDLARQVARVEAALRSEVLNS